MHVFVFPSEWEAFGISMLEAQACGKPVISTKTEGGLYLVDKKFLYSKGDLKQLFKFLEKFKKNPGLGKKIGKNNKEKAKSFVWSKISQDLLEIYNKI